MGPSGPVNPTDAMLDQEMGRRAFFRRMAIMGAVASPAVAAACGIDTESTKAVASTTSTSTTEAPTTTIESEAERKKRQENFEKDYESIFPQDPTGENGFMPGETAIGSQVDKSKDVNHEAGASAFSAGVDGMWNQDGNNSLNSGEEISWYLISDNKRAKAVHQALVDELSDEPEELFRALSGEGYVETQVLVDAAVKGSSYYGEDAQGNPVVEKLDPGTERAVKAGDRYYLFVRKDGTIVKEATLRADCINPGIETVRPIRPGEPVPPSIIYGPRDKVPYERTHDAHPEPGRGGDPENGMDPQNDSDETGYGPGDTPRETVPPVSHPQATVPASPNTTSAPLPPSPSTPATTAAPRPTITSPPLGD